jgi:tetratricopeptide (TPR) repeat protein
VLQAAAGVSPMQDGIERSHVIASQYPADADDELSLTLSALDNLELRSPQPAAAGPDVDVDQVFAKFKEGIRSQVDESDSATHYDLGVAYKEMGLTADSIRELELAARDPFRECMCYAMIGLIHLEQNELDEAAQAYVRGLEASKKTIDQEMSLYYDLGIVNEIRGDYPEAIYYFRKISRKDPGFRDVRERLSALEGALSDGAVPAKRNTLDDDELERAFDDLFGNR